MPAQGRERPIHGVWIQIGVDLIATKSRHRDLAPALPD